MTTSILLFFLSPLLKWVTGTYLIAAIGGFIFFFTPAWVPGRFRNIAGVVAVCALTGGSFYWYAFHAGEKHQARKFAAKDAAAIENVRRGETEVEACNGGIDWDVSTGVCLSK